MSATTRMVLDSVRTLTIWAYGLGVGWETFAPLQIVGFALLLLGTFVYNNILIVPALRKWGVLPPDTEKDSKVQVVVRFTEILFFCYANMLTWLSNCPACHISVKATASDGDCGKPRFLSYFHEQYHTVY